MVFKILKSSEKQEKSIKTKKWMKHHYSPGPIQSTNNRSKQRQVEIKQETQSKDGKTDTHTQK